MRPPGLGLICFPSAGDDEERKRIIRCLLLNVAGHHEDRGKLMHVEYNNVSASMKGFFLRNSRQEKGQEHLVLHEISDYQ